MTVQQDVDIKVVELNEQKDRQKEVLKVRIGSKLKSLEEELVARHQVDNITQ